MDINEVKKPKKEFYTLKEVSDFMGIPHHKVRRLVVNGKIKAVNLAISGNGKKPIYGIKPEEIQNYYDSIHNTINRVKGVN